MTRLKITDEIREKPFREATTVGADFTGYESSMNRSGGADTDDGLRHTGVLLTTQSIHSVDAKGRRTVRIG